MKRFALFACGLLTVVLAPPARADDNEAERLFRAMEKKIQQANAFKAAITIKTKGGKNKAARFAGSLLLTIDSQTLLPLKRVTVLNLAADLPKVTVTEIYDDFTLDPKIDGRTFEMDADRVKRQP